jgi:hypothetical protein
MPGELPSAKLGEQAPTGQIAQLAPADVAVYLGCAGGGSLANLAIKPFGAQQLGAISAVYKNGPLCAEGGYIANKTPVQCVCVQLPATSVNAVASAITTSGTGTELAQLGAIGGTISDGFDVVVQITTGGTVGTSYAYEVSLDGGVTFGTPISVTTSLSMAITGTLNGVSIATGITLALTTAYTFVLGDTIAFWTKPASASILTTTITRVAGSTSTLVFSGTPADEYEILVQFLTGGTEGAGNTITFWVSLDGGLTFGQVQQLATAGTYLIPDGAGSTGVTLTVGSGTISAGDTVAAKTTAPVYAFADVQTAMNAVRNWSGVWSFFFLTGRSTRAMRDSVEALMQTYAASGRYTWSCQSARDRIAGETVTTGSTSYGNVGGDLAWSGRVIAEWATSIGDRTPSCAGSMRVTSPMPGARQNRRTVALGYIGRTISISPDRDPGDRTLPNEGALSADALITIPTSGIIAPANPGALIEHDARVNPSLYQQGFNIVRTWFGETGLAPGIYPAGGNLMSAATAIQLWCYRRVMNLADAAAYKAMGSVVLSNFGVWPATARNRTPGNIMDWDLDRFYDAVYNAVYAAVSNYVSAPSQGGILVVINPTPAVVGGNTTVYQTTTLTPKRILQTFSGTIGFTNPALNASSTPAAA